MSQNMWKKNLVLVSLAVVVFLVSLSMGIGRSADPEEPMVGTDATAVSVIEENHPDYEPWFSPFWENPGGEIESGLFALQAGIGGGIIGFALATFLSRRRVEEAVAAATAPSSNND